MTMYYLDNPEGCDLLLDDCKFKGGDLVAGWVVNGEWYFRIKGEKFEAYYDGKSKKPVRSWLHNGYEIYEVPKEIRKKYCSWEYQPIMDDMEKHLGLNQGFTHSLTGKEIK